MTAMLSLIGGEEFSAGFEDVHAELMKLVMDTHYHFDRPIQITFLATCAAHDGPEKVDYWCEQARQRLGVLEARVFTPRIIDRESADDSANAAQIAEADWIYIGGGFPHTGMSILKDTLSMRALQTAYHSAALISGASAGAMLLCSDSWIISPEMDEAVSHALETGESMEGVDIPIPEFIKCLGFLPNTLCWPHHNIFHSTKLLKNGGVPKGVTVIGIDEQTAIVSNFEGCWPVLGRGKVSIIDGAYRVENFSAGACISLPQPI